MKRKSIFVVALLVVAAATTACRREIPEPRGLGAASLTSQHSVAK